jgi:hypothetical protein
MWGDSSVNTGLLRASKWVMSQLLKPEDLIGIHVSLQQRSTSKGVG